MPKFENSLEFKIFLLCVLKNVIFKYLKVAPETLPEKIAELFLQYWKLPAPKLILSVTGGAKQFTIPQHTKKAFKQGLIKAAASTGAWIITGSTHTGVMRLVGEAVAEEGYKYNLKEKELPIIGIATWGIIYKREDLIVSFFYLRLFLKIKVTILDIIDYIQNNIKSRFFWI